MDAINATPLSNNGREYWVPLLGLAAQEVFASMLASQVVSSPEPIAEAEPLNITAMVGLAGHLCGILTVKSSEKAATLMCSKMLGIEASQAGPQMYDAVGEVCNMIAGNFKNKIAGMNDATMLSVPTVIIGDSYSLHSLTDSGRIGINLLFEGLPLIVSLEVHS